MIASTNIYNKFSDIYIICLSLQAPVRLRHCRRSCPHSRWHRPTVCHPQRQSPLMRLVATRVSPTGCVRKTTISRNEVTCIVSTIIHQGTQPAKPSDSTRLQLRTITARIRAVPPLVGAQWCATVKMDTAALPGTHNANQTTPT